VSALAPRSIVLMANWQAWEEKEERQGLEDPFRIDTRRRLRPSIVWCRKSRDQASARLRAAKRDPPLMNNLEKHRWRCRLLSHRTHFFVHCSFGMWIEGLDRIEAVCWDMPNRSKTSRENLRQRLRADRSGEDALTSGASFNLCVFYCMPFLFNVKTS
jgi:hypothetical protein